MENNSTLSRFATQSVGALSALPPIAAIAYTVSLLFRAWLDMKTPIWPLNIVDAWMMAGYVISTAPLIVALSMGRRPEPFAWLASVLAGAVALLFAHHSIMSLAVPGFTLVLFMTYVLADYVNARNEAGAAAADAYDRQMTYAAPPAAAQQDRLAQNTIMFPAKRARYTLNDVDGMSDTVDKLVEAIKAASNSSSSATAPQGILLHGDAGGGKTFLPEAVAGQFGLRFMPVDISGINSRWVGETTERLVKAFDDAIAQAPVVMLIDEVDSIIPDRSKVANSDSEVVKTVNAFLTQMNRIRGTGVVVVAATNYPDRLDAAAIREGRFDWKIKVPMPDLEARVGMLSRALAKGGAGADPAVLTQIAKRWEGFSVARLQAIGREALKTARGAKSLSATQLMAAYLTVRGEPAWALPENTPDLSGVYLDGETEQRLRGLGNRMRNILDIEAKGGSIPRGVLFYGPPGTGKTLVARALAKESGWTFVATKGPDLLNNNDEIEKVIERASAFRPSIVFIDEAEDILMERSSSPMTRQSTNKLLAEIDGADKRLHDVMFIAATNHPDVLDAAMLRGGRFGQKVEFRLPTRDTIARFVADWMGKNTIAANRDLTPAAIAAEMDGGSLADVDETLKSAINVAIDGGSTRVSIAHLRTAASQLTG